MSGVVSHLGAAQQPGAGVVQWSVGASSQVHTLFLIPPSPEADAVFPGLCHALAAARALGGLVGVFEPGTSAALFPPTPVPAPPPAKEGSVPGSSPVLVQQRTAGNEARGASASRSAAAGLGPKAPAEACDRDRARRESERDAVVRRERESFQLRLKGKDSYWEAIQVFVAAHSTSQTRL